jgi:hypothetical protein
MAPSSTTSTTATAATTSFINTYTMFFGFVISSILGVMAFAPALVPAFITSILSSQWIKDNPITTIIIVLVIMIMVYAYYTMYATK